MPDHRHVRLPRKRTSTGQHIDDYHLASPVALAAYEAPGDPGRTPMMTPSVIFGPLATHRFGDLAIAKIIRECVRRKRLSGKIALHSLRVVLV